tara:strand:- start:239 stop:379 length:141 start_codon:yes stop_codon:yes gene_type:complete
LDSATPGKPCVQNAHEGEVRDWEKTSSLNMQLQTAQNELPVFFIKD